MATLPWDRKEGEAEDHFRRRLQYLGIPVSAAEQYGIRRLSESETTNYAGWSIERLPVFIDDDDPF